ncbi:hypothetical protein mRhiFer1_009515 [Rhinolophus ferrumequinum]|uniref:Uncharacterized protein n=1 Tax=Rhinolophus ferrumequinum TaxID=59479 RepID=A0A7J7RAU9_RHIFE|nr:hypothetical protein mRhiFer1_009515 [Rhinolophus ferrumequinum]
MLPLPDPPTAPSGSQNCVEFSCLSLSLARVTPTLDVPQRSTLPERRALANADRPTSFLTGSMGARPLCACSRKGFVPMRFSVTYALHRSAVDTEFWAWLHSLISVSNCLLLPASCNVEADLVVLVAVSENGDSTPTPTHLGLVRLWLDKFRIRIRR